MEERIGEGILPYEGKSAYLFVSYTPADWGEISGLLGQMRDRGLRFWLSSTTPEGPERDEIIARKLEDCGCFVAFLSERYLGDLDVMDELNYSRDNEKKQVLIYLNQTELPAGVQMRMSRARSLQRQAYPSERELFADLMKTEGFERFYGVDSPALAAQIEKKLPRLAQLYPDHRVFALRGLDQELAEGLAQLCAESEYETLEELLRAYGYLRIDGEEARRQRGGPVCSPGAEPEVIRPAIANALKTLEEYYPDRQIAENLQHTHKALHTRLFALHQWLGYEDLADFLEAYGFRCFFNWKAGRKGRGKEAYLQVLDELRACYRDREKPRKLTELTAARPELGPVLKTMNTHSRELFGMPLKEKLVQEGILRPPEVSAAASGGRAAILRRLCAAGGYGSIEEVEDRLNGVELRRARGDKILISRVEDCDEELQIPRGVWGIRREAFSEADGVKRVVLPEGCTALAERAFADCGTLEEAVLPEDLETLEIELFAGCKSLRSVTLPSALKRIGSRAFLDCTSLERIVIPASTQIIESGAFQGCTRLAQVELLSDKTSVFDGAFEGCPFSLPKRSTGGVEYQFSVGKNNRAAITGFSGRTEQLEIPDMLSGHPVTAIAKDAFAGHAELREILLPDSITEAKGDVFRDCAGLERLRLSNGLAKLTSTAFAGCVNLREVNIPEAMPEVKRGLFKDSPVELLHLGKSTRRVDPNAFFHREYDAASGALLRGKTMRRILIDPENRDLRAEGTLLFSGDGKILLADLGDQEECIVPEGVEEIGENAFNKNQFLRSVTLPSTLRSIGAGAFAETGLETVRFPASLRSIGEQAFAFCRQLREAKLPEGLESLGDQAFAGCPILEVRLPASLSELGGSCFAILSAYQGEVRQSFSVALGNERYHTDGQVLYRTEGGEQIALKAFDYGLRSPLGQNEPADRHYRLEAGTTAVAEQAFYRCDRLASVELPETLRSIGARAFMDCAALTVSGLGDGVEIGLLAFGGTPLQT